jgi:hypothetical protein
MGSAASNFSPPFFVAAIGQNASHVRMKMLFPFFVLLALGASAADTNAPASSKTNVAAPFKIGTADAAKYYDQEMIVTGRVAQVTIRPAVTFLNLDEPYPDSPFTIVIFHGHSSFYGDANALRGKAIEIRGKIKNYHDKPEIALDNTNQLTVIGGWTPSAKAPPVPLPAKPSPLKPSTNAPPATEVTNFPEVMERGCRTFGDCRTFKPPRRWRLARSSRWGIHLLETSRPFLSNCGTIPRGWGRNRGSRRANAHWRRGKTS